MVKTVMVRSLKGMFKMNKISIGKLGLAVVGFLAGMALAVAGVLLIVLNGG